MEFLVINLKEYSPPLEVAMANLEIEIESSKKSKIVKGIKIIHGYGSHGIGGKIKLEVKKYLKKLKAKKIISDVIDGIDWNIGYRQTFDFLINCPSASSDIDLNKGNLGITILVL